MRVCLVRVENVWCLRVSFVTVRIGGVVNFEKVAGKGMETIGKISGASGPRDRFGIENAVGVPGAVDEAKADIHNQCLSVVTT